MPLVSIVTPVYNVESTLSRCLDSLLGQTYKNIEIIPVDDGSKDRSYDICCEYATKDKRVKPIHTINQGSGPARNAGIAAATGDWIYFPDSDDILAPDAIETCIREVSKAGCDLLVFGFDAIRTNGSLVWRKEYPSKIVDGLSARNSYENHCAMHGDLLIQGAPWNKFFKMSVIKEFNVEFPQLRRHQDEGFICRYVSHTQKICFIPQILYYYYSNDSAKVNKKYPINYIDSVLGLYKIKKETIVSWNPENTKARDIVSDELICNMIWAFELSFNSKYEMDYGKRIQWMKEIISVIDFSELSWGSIDKRFYQKNVIRLLRKIPWVAYMMIRSKLIVQSVIKK